MSESMTGGCTICASQTSLDGVSDMEVPKLLCAMMGQASHDTLLDECLSVGPESCLLIFFFPPGALPL